MKHKFTRIINWNGAIYLVSLRGLYLLDGNTNVLPLPMNISSVKVFCGKLYLCTSSELLIYENLKEKKVLKVIDLVDVYLYNGMLYYLTVNALKDKRGRTILATFYEHYQWHDDSFFYSYNNKIYKLDLVTKRSTELCVGKTFACGDGMVVVSNKNLVHVIMPFNKYTIRWHSHKIVKIYVDKDTNSIFTATNSNWISRLETVKDEKRVLLQVSGKFIDWYFDEDTLYVLTSCGVTSYDLVLNKANKATWLLQSVDTYKRLTIEKENCKEEGVEIFKNIQKNTASFLRPVYDAGYSAKETLVCTHINFCLFYDLNAHVVYKAYEFGTDNVFYSRNFIISTKNNKGKMHVSMYVIKDDKLLLEKDIKIRFSDIIRDCVVQNEELYLQTQDLIKVSLLGIKEVVVRDVRAVVCGDDVLVVCSEGVSNTRNLIIKRKNIITMTAGLLYLVAHKGIYKEDKLLIEGTFIDFIEEPELYTLEHLGAGMKLAKWEMHRLVDTRKVDFKLQKILAKDLYMDEDGVVHMIKF